MKEDEAIEYLETLDKGCFLTVNIPIFRDTLYPITVMYMGKDKEGRYNFIDTGKLVLSKEFIERGKITLDKDFNEQEALEIHSNARVLQARAHKKGRIR